MEAFLGGAAVGVGAFLVYLWFKRANSETDEAFRDGLIGDAADWMASSLEVTREAAITALRGLTDQQVDTPVLEALIRVECEIVKKEPDRCTRTVIVGIRKNGKVIIGKIAKDLAWDELPTHIRENFMREKGDTQCFVLVERKVDGG